MDFAIAIDKWHDVTDTDDDFCPYHAAGWTAAESDARASIPQYEEGWQDEAWIDGFCDCLEMAIQRLK
jgi:hypothetical protein